MANEIQGAVTSHLLDNFNTKPDEILLEETKRITSSILNLFSTVFSNDFNIDKQVNNSVSEQLENNPEIVDKVLEEYMSNKED